MASDDRKDYTSALDDEEKHQREPTFDGQEQWQGRKFSLRGSIGRDKKSDNEDPFAAEDDVEGGTKFRTLEWWQAGMIMIAETISLGILSLPSVLASVGIVGGIILIIGLGIIATYTGYVLGQFREAYPHIHTFADAGGVLFAPLGLATFGKEFFGAAQVIFLVFSMGSHILTWTIMLNTVTNHATCTIVWGVIGLIVFFIFDLPRTMKNLSYFSIVSCLSILSAVLITMIGVGVDPPDPTVQVTTVVSFPMAFVSVSNIVFAYAGHVAFFSFIAELKTVNDWPKALFLLQGCDITLYVIAAIVIYRYAGPDVDSPALGSTSDIVKKVAWGMAIPTIIIAGVVYGHVSTKYVYVRMFRGTRHLSARSVLSYGTWAGIALTLWTIAWIIAESIPVFNDLLSLISALFASWFTYGLSGIFWLFLNWGQLFSSPRKIFLTIVNVSIVGIGAAICGIGLYASGYAIHQDAKSSSGSWTCANNGQ